MDWQNPVSPFSRFAPQLRGQRAHFSMTAQSLSALRFSSPDSCRDKLIIDRSFYNPRWASEAQNVVTVEAIEALYR